MNRSACEIEALGLESFGPEDVRLPQLKLKQAETLGAERVPEGSWYLTNDQDGHALSRGLVLLEMRKERSLMLPWSSPRARETLVRRIAEETGVQVALDHEGPVCFSRDRVLPVLLEGLTPVARSCASCPMARWRTVERRNVQGCAESYRLLFWDEGAEAACVYWARGCAIAPVRDLLTNLHVACRRYQRPACGFQIGAAARHVRSLDRSYWVPTFTRPYPHVDPHSWARLTEVREACASAGRSGA